MRFRRAAGSAGLLLLALSGMAALLLRPSAAETSLAQRTATLQTPTAAARVDCAMLRAQQPLVLLVLGQSNAANHAEPGVQPAPPLSLWHGGDCYRAQAPLPGATGQGDSLWPWLNQALGGELAGRPLLFALLAVESTRLADWTEAGPLHSQWQQLLQQLQASQLKVDLVLWQQGEADSRARTTPDAYRQGLRKLQAQLRATGVAAPIMLARSSYCPPAQHQAIHAVQTEFALQAAGFLAGPDTDALQGPARSGGCHFSRTGLQAAAASWVAPLRDWASKQQTMVQAQASH